MYLQELIELLLLAQPLFQGEELSIAFKKECDPSFADRVILLFVNLVVLYDLHIVKVGFLSHIAKIIFKMGVVRDLLYVLEYA